MPHLITGYVSTRSITHSEWTKTHTRHTADCVDTAAYNGTVVGLYRSSDEEQGGTAGSRVTIPAKRRLRLAQRGRCHQWQDRPA